MLNYSLRNIRLLHGILRRSSSIKDVIRRSDFIKITAHSDSQESGELINLSHDISNSGLPQADDQFRKHYLDNAFVEVDINERSTVNLSSVTHANLPEPPTEATKSHDQPYNSTISFGESHERNEKFMLDELLHNRSHDFVVFDRYLNHDKDINEQYLSFEKRFGLATLSDQLQLVDEGLVSMEKAHELQSDLMKEIEHFWKTTNGLDPNGELRLFIPFPLEDISDFNINEFFMLYRILNIKDKKSDLEKYKHGELPLVDLIAHADEAVCEVVLTYFQKYQI